VMEIFPERIRRMKLFPVGRLDKDTEGLLLFTNDGDLAHRMISPKNMVEKVYYAVIEGSLDTEKIQEFETGLVLEEGFVTMPAKLRIISEKENGAETEVTVFEGKFHQVKRMFEAVGCRVTYLKRIQFGSLVLDETQLQAGKYRELSLEEESLIRL
ncbi:MAG TPA: 16S rRNA pseudouridine(516) synthase, partial [Leptospiraceae bacterium]|nr:16S rRNA pseudouridine(516) synthase [Leptospiraceae bacterium]